MGLMLPPDLAGLLNDLGYNWPEADEEKLFELGQAWISFGATLDGLARSANDAATAVWSANTGDAVDGFGRTGPSRTQRRRCWLAMRPVPRRWVRR